MKLDKAVAHDYVRSHYRQGATQAEIAAALGVTQQAISKLMRAAGIKSRGPGRRAPRRAK